MAIANETVRKKMSMSQLKQLIGQLIEAIPDFSSEEARHLNGKKGKVAIAVHEVLMKLARESVVLTQPPDPVTLMGTAVTIEVSNDAQPELSIDSKDWKLLEDVTVPVGMVKLELAAFLNLKGDGNVDGDTMIARAKKLGPLLGERHAHALLKNQHQIPTFWRKHYLVFPGTIRRDQGGDRRVCCLGWDGGTWFPHWRWLDEGAWNMYGRVVRTRT